MRLKPNDIADIEAQAYLPLKLRPDRKLEQIAEHAYELQIIKLWLRLTPDERIMFDERYTAWVQTLGTYAWGKGSDDVLLDQLYIHLTETIQ